MGCILWIFLRKSIVSYITVLFYLQWGPTACLWVHGVPGLQYPGGSTPVVPACCAGCSHPPGGHAQESGASRKRCHQGSRPEEKGEIGGCKAMWNQQKLSKSLFNSLRPSDAKLNPEAAVQEWQAGDKPLPEPVLAKISEAIGHPKDTVGMELL